jgi:three-Cys-motif partner protein
MSHEDETPRLFDPSSHLLSDEDLAADVKAALEGQAQRDLDSARMWESREDGLIVRGVKAHSAHKSQMVTANLDTVTTAMGGKWFAQKHGLQFLELYSGPGRLLDVTLGKELDGSPLRALDLRRPFDKYVFNDVSDDCVKALGQRVAGREQTIEVHRGSAYDLDHLAGLAASLDERALIIGYLDPARPQDLKWPAIKFLAENFQYLDLIVNVPVNSLVRAIAGRRAGGHDGPGAAGEFLNHPRPWELLQHTVTGKLVMNGSMQAVRAHLDAQLMNLGFLRPARRSVDFPPGHPYYDMVLASHHPRALELWEKTNPEPLPAQLDLLGDIA